MKVTWRSRKASAPVGRRLWGLEKVSSHCSRDLLRGRAGGWGWLWGCGAFCWPSRSGSASLQSTGTTFATFARPLCLPLVPGGPWGWVCRERRTSKSGSSKKKVEPCPRPLEEAPMTPPCSSTRFLEIHSPRPDPPPFCSAPASNCTYWPKSRRWFSALMPAPLSSTLTRTKSRTICEPPDPGGFTTRPSCRRCSTSTRTSPLGLRQNLRALEMKFLST
mmetsp:Transcript_9624/g.13160  ORF Transcript_9624/g.13160 Transcript_9624/m.13160 type:complete len:219 (+) Transcript_9624:55-711(+)